MSIWPSLVIKTEQFGLPESGSHYLVPLTARDKSIYLLAEAFDICQLEPLSTSLNKRKSAATSHASPGQPDHFDWYSSMMSRYSRLPRMPCTRVLPIVDMGQAFMRSIVVSISFEFKHFNSCFCDDNWPALTRSCDVAVHGGQAEAKADMSFDVARA